MKKYIILLTVICIALVSAEAHAAIFIGGWNGSKVAPKDSSGNWHVGYSKDRSPLVTGGPVHLDRDGQSATPEPASMTLLGLGLAGLFIRRKKEFKFKSGRR